MKKFFITISVFMLSSMLITSCGSMGEEDDDDDDIELDISKKKSKKSKSSSSRRR
jgi:hypothetical protein